MFRRQFVQLKAHVPDALDYDRFQNFLQASKVVVVADDEMGNPRVMLVLAVRDDQVSRMRLLQWEYAFIASEHRGDPRIYAIWWWLIARHTAEVPGWSVWCAAWAYPGSYFVLRGSLQGLVSLQSPGLSSDARAALVQFARDITDGSFDPTTGVRNMPTIPLENMDQRSNRSIVRRARQEYIAANPRWSEGYTLAVVAPISIKSLWAMTATAVRRSVRLVRPNWSGAGAHANPE